MLRLIFQRHQLSTLCQSPREPIVLYPPSVPISRVFVAPIICAVSISSLPDSRSRQSRQPSLFTRPPRAFNASSSPTTSGQCTHHFRPGFQIHESPPLPTFIYKLPHLASKDLHLLIPRPTCFCMECPQTSFALILQKQLSPQRCALVESPEQSNLHATPDVEPSVAKPLAQLVQLRDCRLQSACTAVIAISGIRVAIGLTALTAAAGLHPLHMDSCGHHPCSHDGNRLIGSV